MRLAWIIDCSLQMVYDGMVKDLIASHEGEAVQKTLSEAFERLLPLGTQALPLRKEKRAFRERFEAFLNDIQGLLCLSH